MHRIFHQWRYRRAQKAGAFKLPEDRKSGKIVHVDLGSYLSQSSGRSRSFKRYASPRKQHGAIWTCLVIFLILLFGWVVPESIAAIELFQR
ncbi:MAG: hypothetical protein VXU48_05050 [Verrucomicrobiota bacterium]|nr:hypothetical protein [Verrucomicrobiota bacterium]MEC8333180.1 hypothetical protein [Verrucomicrobiota bacterium]